jgi:hypothetical protein
MVQTYISAALGNVVSQAATRGISGAPDPLDFTGAFLIGGQVGTAFIAYPVAVHILKNRCAAFKKIAEDPKAPQAQVWIKGGLLGAAIVTASNYPLGLAYAAHRAKGGKSPSFSVKDALGFYVDQIGKSVGFAAASATLFKTLPSTSNSLVNWAKINAIVNVSTLAGRLLAYPVLSLRHGTTLSSIFAESIHSLPGMVITGDATNSFKGVLGFIVQ